MPSSPLIDFRNEDAVLDTSRHLKILTVDDDKDFQQSMQFALSTMRIPGMDIEVVQAFSCSEAARLLTHDNDFAIALVDVIMETDDAGLRLVKAVRDVLGNSEIRIILVTGQPGMTPMNAVMQDYDIDDYWTKTDLVTERLTALITANARSYNNIRQIARAKRGLQLIAESSGALYASRNMEELSSMMLAELARLFDVPADGLVCARRKTPTELTQDVEYTIISANGLFSAANGQQLADFSDKAIQQKLYECLEKKETILFGDSTCLYFSDNYADADYAVYLATSRNLDATEAELLRVFSINVHGGLINVSLVSELDRLAYEDAMLKIPNSNILLKALNRILDRPDRQQEFNLLILDIDKFSQINTVLGVEQGDAMLHTVARRLRDGLDKSVLTARLKDDKFALLGTQKLLDKNRVLAALDRDLDHKHDSIAINVSTVTFPLALASGSPQDILTRARSALKNAKLRGIKQHVVYSGDSESDDQAKFTLLTDLQKALARGEISIALQPQWNVATNQITGVESLARWRRADGSWVPPDVFIPIAEASGLISTLSRQTNALSFFAAKTLADRGYGHVRVSINLSVSQLENADMLEALQSDLADSRIAPDQVELEITETVTMQHFERVVPVLESFRSQGFRIAIDDFGTGFSSLTYLHLLPADRLKIDKSFVDHVAEDAESALVTEMVIALGKKFGMNVIAEGVETETQLAWLRANGCVDIQGYVKAQPMPLEALLKWLNTECDQS